MNPANREWTFNFGKHRGKTMADVIATDPQYIVWCFDNLNWFDVEAEIMDEIGRNNLDREFTEVARQA